MDNVEAVSHQDRDALSLKGTPPNVVVFQSRARLKQISNTPEPRYTRRLSDLITASFFEACRIGNLEVAKQFMDALECEVMRSLHVAGADNRDDGNDLATVQVRYAQEIKKRALDHIRSEPSATG